MENYLEYYYKKYPKSELEDYLKLIYQASFGSDYIEDNPAESLSKIKEDMLKKTNHEFHEDLYDFISPEFVRVNLRIFKQYNLNENLLNENYFNTLRKFLNPTDSFKNELKTLKIFFLKKGIETSELNNYIDNLDLNDFIGLKHSELYENSYSPAYRIIHYDFLSEDLQYYQIRHYLESFPKTKVNFFAIEGKAASGKTTISNLLEREKDINVIHLDDFLDGPSDENNVNSLRLIKEIINPAILDNPLKYKKYDATYKTYSDGLIDNVTSTVLIEGVFSSNYILEEYYRGIIYLHVPTNTQNARFQSKSRAIYSRFLNERLPKEAIYYKKYNIYKKADLIV